MKVFSRKSDLRLLKTLAAVAIVALLAVVLWHRAEGRAKGTPVTWPNLIAILACATAAALLTKQLWSPIPTPFIAALAGAFGTFDPHCVPFGVVVGLLVGTLVVLLVPATPRQPEPPSQDNAPEGN